MTCWDPIVCPAGEELLRQLGPLTLRVRRQDDEWHAALSYDMPAQKVPGATPAVDEPAWRRWVVADGSGGLTLTPVMPEKAVVVRPKYALSLVVGESALFYVTVPAWVRLTALPAGAVLLDAPSALLSKIWYGDFASGELCHSIKTRATRHLDDQPEVDWRVTCPVKVSNLSARDLPLERLCIHVQHLGIFEGGGRLWTPVVTAVFRGDEQVADVVYGSEPPPECMSPVARSQPREPVPENRLWRSFRELASINVF
jgi:hypothetical protein